MLGHVVERDHIPVRHKHVAREIEDLREQLEVACYSSMYRGAPVFRLQFHFLSCIETQSVPPVVRHITNLVL